MSNNRIITVKKNDHKNVKKSINLMSNICNSDDNTACNEPISTYTIVSAMKNKSDTSATNTTKNIKKVVKIHKNKRDTLADIPVDIPVDTPADVKADIPVDIPVDTPADVKADIPIKNATKNKNKVAKICKNKNDTTKNKNKVAKICKNKNETMKNKNNDPSDGTMKPVNEMVKIKSDKGNGIKKVIKFIDLFCGIGSFHNSFEKLGYKCVMACDIAKPARKTYSTNYGMKPLEDVCEIEPKDIENYDILCAGFPCQPFSQAGKHLGFADERGTMFSQVMKFVKYHKPPVIILENVHGLLNHDNGKTFLKIKLDITNENYNITYKTLKCSDYGIPQMRKRLFIIGVRNDVKIKGEIENMLNLKMYEKNITLSKFMNKNFVKDTAYTIRCGGKRSPINDKHNWDGYMVDNVEYRLTIDDCLKLQGFPPNFKLCGSETEKWKLLGNTIPIIFTEIIGKQLNKFIFSI